MIVRNLIWSECEIHDEAELILELGNPKATLVRAELKALAVETSMISLLHGVSSPTMSFSKDLCSAYSIEQLWYVSTSDSRSASNVAPLILRTLSQIPFQKEQGRTTGGPRALPYRDVARQFL